MLKNVNYNLLETITIVSKSLYFKEQREKELSLLLKELKNQIDSGMLTLE